MLNWIVSNRTDPLIVSDLEFDNGPGDRIPGRVIPKTRQMVLDTSLLNTQVSIKYEMVQTRERSNALLFTAML